MPSLDAFDAATLPSPDRRLFVAAALTVVAARAVTRWALRRSCASAGRTRDVQPPVTSRSHTRRAAAMVIPLLAIAALMLAAALVILVRRLQPPDVTLTSVRPDQLTAGQQRLRVGLRVQNPNPIPLPVLAMTYRLWLEEQPIASGDADLRRRVPARGEADMEVMVIGDARHLARTLPALALAPRPWRYRLEGTVAVLPRLRVGYRHVGEIDLKGLLRLAASLR
jgi:LEA14-like dessication related protein